jgi:uncharacterized membrane protein (UPF0127 family)
MAFESFRLGRMSILLAGGLVASAACSRTAPEPAPIASAQTDTLAQKTAAPAPDQPSRCITRLPATAPSVPPPAPASQCPPDPEPGLKMPLADVTFPETPNAPRVEVELAKNPHDVERGLMYRRSMPGDHGMLFHLDGRRDHTFWMHNTCIALDMMFIDDDGLIVGIVEGAEPLTDSVRSVGCPSVYVLEMNAGWSRKHGITPGQKVAIPFSAR